jgi:hypothetical protein
MEAELGSFGMEERQAGVRKVMKMLTKGERVARFVISVK